MNNNNNNTIESGHTKSPTRKRKRRWDAVIVGVGFSIAFALLIAKVAQVTPCEVTNHFNIETKECGLAGDSSTFIGQLSSQHGLGFSIIVQFALITVDFSQELVSHLQQFLQNIGLQ
ncbi:MAG TPA: hypothetical protein VGE82_02525 [Nitrososphaera sp.]|jgi:hypothetical protein